MRYSVALIYLVCLNVLQVQIMRLDVLRILRVEKPGKLEGGVKTACISVGRFCHKSNLTASLAPSVIGHTLAKLCFLH